jgi:hypothetical protein
LSFIVVIFFRNSIYSLIIVILLVIISYFIIIVSSQNTILNTILGTAIFAPLITYVIEYVKKKNEDDSNIKSVVTKYRDDYLKEEEKVLILILDEIARHKIFFELPYPNEKDIIYLSTKHYQSQMYLHSTISNIPIVRIHKYYRNIIKLRIYFQAMMDKKGDLRNIFNLCEFKGLFNIIIEDYSKLNSIFYANLLYNILESRINYLSVNKTDFPIRYTKPFLLELLRSEIFGKINEDQRLIDQKTITILKIIEANPGYNQFADFEYTYGNAHEIEKIIKSNTKFIFERESALIFINHIEKKFKDLLDRINENMEKLERYNVTNP